jgi:penicillin-insensitive murein DD-endopeptidase
VAVATGGCLPVPSSVVPRATGSIGLPHHGMLTDAAELPASGLGYRWLRQDTRHFGLPRFVASIAGAAAHVASERPGAVLAVGDLSDAQGGLLLPHLSHRSGRDADLLLYMETLAGDPVPSPGFIHVEPDGLAWDPSANRFLRLDVARQWLLVRYFVTEPAARTQWLFCNHNVKALLLEWAIARGESGEVLSRADAVLHEPKPGGVHDDHLHVRTACSSAELLTGCEPSGPARWFYEGATLPPVDTSDSAIVALARELSLPLAPPRTETPIAEGRAR